MKVNINTYPNLNDEKKRNINSAYNDKKSGIISEKQYSDNLKKNGVSSGYLNSSANFPKEFKREKSSLESKYNDIMNSQKEKSYTQPMLTPQRSKIPSEKLEQERLRNLTGEYNLEKVHPEKLENSIRLKNKTPDDYYRERFDDLQKERERIDEAFGPKTDFSISNFENNYDKMNKEEQGMLTHKMQLEFNRQGYRDKDGFSLKTDGIYGNKTRGVYERYIKDNKEAYKEAIERKNGGYKIKTLKDIASEDNLKKDYEPSVLSNTNEKPFLLSTANKESNQIIPKDYITVASSKNNKSITTPVEEKEPVFKTPDNSVGKWLNEADERNKKITTEVFDDTMYTNKNGVNYTMYNIIQRLIDAKKQYMVAQRNGNTKLMNIHREVGKYLKAMIKMSNEYSGESGDKKFAEMVLDAENYDSNGSNPYESIKKWENIQTYSIGLANSDGKTDSANNTRGITIGTIDGDIAKIYTAFKDSDNPVIYLASPFYTQHYNDGKNPKGEDDNNASNNELIYYYTNDENKKEKFRPSLLPGNAGLDSGDPKDSGAGILIEPYQSE